MKHLIGCWLLLAATVDGEPLIFRDAFAGKLDKGWTWRRENPAAWRIASGVLEIRIEPGNMWGPQNDARNVLLRKLEGVTFDHDVRASLTVSNKPTAQYEQVDLVWYYDDSHMVKIGHELVDGQLSIVMGREEKDRTRTIAIIPIDALQVDLRLAVTNKTIHGSFRPAASKGWRHAGSCDLPVRGEPHIAIQCYQGPANAEHWARLANFELHATRP